VTSSQNFTGIICYHKANLKENIKEETTMKYVCDVCGWEYDEELGYPEGGIAPGTKWEDVPEDFECPLCMVGKDQFSEA
jgi:rubredoxin-NAD+ reductase